MLYRYELRPCLCSIELTISHSSRKRINKTESKQRSHLVIPNSHINIYDMIFTYIYIYKLNIIINTS